MNICYINLVRCNPPRIFGGTYPKKKKNLRLLGSFSLLRLEKREGERRAKRMGFGSLYKSASFVTAVTLSYTPSLRCQSCQIRQESHLLPFVVPPAAVFQLIETPCSFLGALKYQLRVFDSITIHNQRR